MALQAPVPTRHAADRQGGSPQAGSPQPGSPQPESPHADSQQADSPRAGSPHGGPALARRGPVGWLVRAPAPVKLRVLVGTLVALCCAWGALGAWTVNETADMRGLYALDAICTDRPDLLKGL